LNHAKVAAIMKVELSTVRCMGNRVQCVSRASRKKEPGRMREQPYGNWEEGPQGKGPRKESQGNLPGVNKTVGRKQKPTRAGKGGSRKKKRSPAHKTT